MTAFLAQTLLMASLLAPQQTQAGLVRTTADERGRAEGVILGRVVSERSGQPLEAAVVRVIGVSGAITATDSAGTYRISGVPAGSRMVQARGVDHLPLQVEVIVVPEGVTNLELALELAPVPLPAINVIQRRLTEPDSVPEDATRIGPTRESVLASAVETLGSSPGVAELGLAEAIRSAHGPEPPDPSDILYVRGATADLKAVYLDGAPVYAPVHLGGLSEAFHPGLLASGQLHTGGASARYDGGLSYVLDLRSRPGRGGGVRTEGALDLTVARALAEGSLSSHSNFLAGGRFVHGAGSRLWTGRNPRSTYREMFGRIDGAVGVSGQVGGMLFWNEETVDLSEELPDAGAIHWGNVAGSLRFQGDIPEGEALITLAFGSFGTRLPVDGSEFLVIEGRSERQRAAVDLSHWKGTFRLDYGLSAERVRLEHTALSVADTVYVEARLQGDILAGYAAGEYALAPGLRIRGGLRANAFLGENGGTVATRLSPRGEVSWNVSDRAVLSLGVGRYHQFVQEDSAYVTPDELALLQPPDSSGEFRIARDLGVAGATHIVVDLEQAFEHGVRFGIQGFYKNFESVTGIDRPDVEASGIDVWVRRAGAVWESTLGYSHGWVWSVEDTSVLSTSVFAGRHLVDAALSARLGVRNRVKLRTTYATGLPYTAIPHGGGETHEVITVPPPATLASIEETPGASVSNLPRGSYLRVEGEVSRTWLGGEPADPFEVTAYLRVMNGLDRRDAMFVRVDPDGADLGDPSMPVLPIVGVRWSF